MNRLVCATDVVPATIPALVTVPNVEILEVGEDWETSTGVFTWTPDDLQSAIESQQDPGIRTPVNKLGHTDPRFDGQPAIGRVLNLRTKNNGMTLVGDLSGVPSWLAGIMASAYPRRSIEGWFDYTSRTGNEWPFVLTALALLGEAYPAINTLEDIQALYGAEVPELVPPTDTGEVIASRVTDHGTWIRATKGGTVRWRRRTTDQPDDTPQDTPKPVEATTMPRSVRAAVAVDDIRRAFYEAYDQPQYYWWWVRAVYVDPLELIVDDDEGNLYRVTYTINGDAVVFGEPTSVKIEYVDVAAAMAEMPGTVMASYADATVSGRPRRQEPSPTSASTSIPPDGDTEGDRDVNLSEDALRALGLEPGATDDEINAVIVAQTSGDGDPADAPPNPPTPQPTPTPNAPTTQPETPATAPTATPTPAPEETPAPVVPEGMVAVDAAAWEEMRRSVAAAAELVSQTRNTERDKFLDDAVRAGKFPKARRDHYLAMWEADPVGARATIESLAAGLVPVTEQGHGGGDVPNPTDHAYPESWKPAVANAHKGVGTRIKVVAD